MKVKITRKEDGLEKSGILRYIEFEDNRGKELHYEPKVGYSLILDPGISYTWMTSEIIEVISECEIKTKNSTYLIEKL